MDVSLASPQLFALDGLIMGAVRPNTSVSTARATGGYGYLGVWVLGSAIASEKVLTSKKVLTPLWGQRICCAQTAKQVFDLKNYFDVAKVLDVKQNFLMSNMF